jgi:prephenate dehydrogenase
VFVRKSLSRLAALLPNIEPDVVVVAVAAVVEVEVVEEVEEDEETMLIEQVMKRTILQRLKRTKKQTPRPLRIVSQHPLAEHQTIVRGITMPLWIWTPMGAARMPVMRGT